MNMFAAVVVSFALAGAALAGASGASAGTTAPRPPYGYVADSGADEVVPFDASFDAELGDPGPSIPVTGSPGAMATAPNGMFVYVASAAGVTPIGTDFDKAGPLIAVPGGVASMAVTPDGKALYVTTGRASATANTVIPVSTVSKKAGYPVTFAPGPGAHPSPLVITPDGKTVYVASALGTVTPISTATGKPGPPVRVGVKDPAGTAGLAISPDGKTLYAFDIDPGRTVTTVTPISTATNKAGKPVKVGQQPQTIAFSPDSKTAYVVSTGQGPEVDVGAKVTPVSTATNTPGPFISLGPTATSMEAAVTPDGAKIYIGAIWSGPHNGTVFSISAAAGTIRKEFFPGYPRGIAITPDGARAFIVDRAPAVRPGLNPSGVVESITIATDHFHGGFEIGAGSAAIVITP